MSPQDGEDKDAPSRVGEIGPEFVIGVVEGGVDVRGGSQLTKEVEHGLLLRNQALSLGEDALLTQVGDCCREFVKEQGSNLGHRNQAEDLVPPQASVLEIAGAALRGHGEDELLEQIGSTERDATRVEGLEDGERSLIILNGD